MLDIITLAANTEMPFQHGDGILVSFGDTPILGTICSASSFAEGKIVAWNVRTDASAQTYPIHQGFLRDALVTVN